MEGKKGRGLILAAVGIAVLYWISQALMDAIILTEGDFFQQLWSPAAHELWMRVLVVCAITLIGAYAQQVVDERRRAGERLEHLTLVLRAIGNVNQLITKEKDRDRLLKGVCDNLTGTRVYHNAWIALLDESVGLIATAESGLGEEFLPMLEQLKRGELPDCARRVMGKLGVVAIEDPPSVCISCPLAPRYAGRGDMAVRLEYNGKTYGLLVVSTPKDSALDEEEQALLEEVARNIASTLYNIELEEERQLTEAALRQSEAKNRALLNAVPDVMYRISRDSTFLEFKAAKGDASYAPPIEFIGRRIDEMLPAEVAKATSHSVEQVLQTGEMQIFEYQLPVGDDMHSYEARATASGQDEILLMVRDITKRKQAEEAVQKHAHDLGKRVKELDCLYGASRLMAELDRPADKVFREVAGFIPRSWQYPEITCARITFRGQQFKTDNFKETAWRQSADVMVFGKKAGSVEVHYLQEKPTIDEGPFLKEERDLIDALAREAGEFAERQRVEEMLLRHTHDLSKRVRELDCLYGALKLMTEPDRSMEEVFREIVGLIPPSWQYPDIACARITFRGQQFKTDNFKETAWQQSADIRVFGEKAGSVEVHYLREKPNVDEGPFLKEERGLIDALAREIGKFIERQRMEEEIRKHRDHLEEVVAERTAELAKTNEELQTEIIERKQAEEEIGKFKIIADNATYGVSISDLEGRLTYVNDTYVQMHGYTADELIGKHFSILYTEEQAKFMESRRKRIFQTGSAVDEVWHKKKDGSVFPVLATGIAVKDDKGKPLYIAATHFDITERQQVEEAQREARKAAEAANQAKGEFLARMSHEVRTPIHGIMGMLELVQETKLSRDQRDYLDIASTSAESLLNIINSILDFSKIGARKLEREDTDFDLRTALEHTVEAQALVAHRKGLELSCHLPPEIPTALVGDAGHLRQVLINLIHNAVKFTKQGEVVVRVAMVAERKQEVKLHFAVCDTGIGIPEDKLKLIFGAFLQADGSASRQYDGTGLGLAISKQLVELMGGRLQVESRVGEGSVFHFTLKFKKQAYARTPVAPLEAMAEWRGLPVLVVDDNETNRHILREMLGYWGFKVTEAGNSPAGLRELKKAKKASRHFRLVLLDKTMPEMDSGDMVRRIQDAPALKDTIVMMLPSGNVPGDAGRCRELGITYLVKPIRQSALLGAVQTALGAVPDEAEKEKEKEPEPVTSDLAAGPRWRILLAEDNTASQMIVRDGLEKKGHVVLVAKNGLEVLRILEKEDFDLILMDMEMPQMDGLEATRTVRRREAKTGQHIPILAMTAYAMEEDKQRCLEAGMDGYVSKPVTYKKLYRIIEDLLSPDKKYESAPPVDVAAALELVDGDEELLQAAVRMFLEEDCPRQMEMLRAGLEQQDALAVKEAAHGIKGAASNLGGRVVSAVALRLETIGREGDLAGTDGLLGELEAELARFAAFFSGRDLAYSRKGPPAG